MEANCARIFCCAWKVRTYIWLFAFWLTRCPLIISAGARDWKPGSHWVGAGKRCPETPWAATRLRGRLVKSWHRNLLCLLVLLCFTSCLVSTDRACEYVTRSYLLLFFRRMPPLHHTAADSLVTFCPSHRLAYSRYTLRLDMHTKNIQTHKFCAFKHTARLLKENSFCQWRSAACFLWQSSLSFC